MLAFRHRTPAPPPAEAAPRLAAEGLWVGYGAAPVVRDVTLAVRPGEITALVGPNGCGKSTLLRALGRVLRPSAGTVTLNGRPIGAWPTREVARRLALLPQGPVAPEGLTVAELVAQGRFPHRSAWGARPPGDRAAVERALAACDLLALAGRPLAALSGGQRQRAWIAMALAQDTPLLLLDEPTTFLDLKVQVDVMALLARVVAGEGRTLVVVLHELNLAAAFADRVVMMREGRVVADGPPATAIGPAALRAVFDLAADVIPDPVTGRPVCLPRVPL